MFYDKEIIDIRDSVTTSLVEQTMDINDLFIQKIISLIGQHDKIVDIGTGNGFVLSQILKSTDIKCSLIGIDNSIDMVTVARNNLVNNAVILQADNYLLPFEDKTIDIITAKNVTNFSPFEIFRVLKPDGYFIFREYGPGKGLLEIAEMFKGRLIGSCNEYYYTELLIYAGLRIVSFEKYQVTRRYKDIQALINITKSYPFVKNYSSIDENQIREKFGHDIVVTSDPFILVAQK